MISSIFFQGIIIGILVSIPMGPIGVLCVQRTLQQGRKSGFISGIGAASADSFFAAIAGFGVTFVSSFFENNQFYIMLAGALVLIFFGLRLFFTNAITQVRKLRLKKNNYLSDYVSVFFLTLSNPITIIFFGLVFAGIGFVKNNPHSFLIVIAGIFTGAIAWWFLLSSVVNMFRKYFRLRIIFYINRFAGVLIVMFGIIAAFNAFYPEIGRSQFKDSKIVNFSNKIQDTIK